MSYHLKQRPLPSGKGYRKIPYHRSPETRCALGLGDQVDFPGSPESDCHVDDLFDFVQYDEDGDDPMSPISSHSEGSDSSSSSGSAPDSPPGTPPNGSQPYPSHDLQGQDDKTCSVEEYMTTGLDQGYPPAYQEGITAFYDGNDFAYSWQQELGDGPNAASAHGHHHRLSKDSHSSGSRTRTVPNPELTNLVRSRGACLSCRIQKIPSDIADPCPPCEKQYGGWAGLTCIRQKLGSILFEGGHARWRETHDRLKQEQMQSSAWHFLQPTHPTVIDVILPHPDDPSCLMGVPDVLVLQYTSRLDNQGLQCFELAGDVRLGADVEKCAEDDLLARWHSGALQPGDIGGFSDAIARLLSCLARHFRPDFRSKAPTPQQKLPGSVFQLLSLAKILRTKERLQYLFDSAPQSLPAKDERQLRCFAQSQAGHLESQILTSLDAYLDDKVLKNASSEETISFWASLWGMILFYREMMFYYEAVTDVNFRPVTDKLHRALIVMVHSYFRTKKVHNQFMSWNQMGQSAGSGAVFRSFAAAWEAKQNFYAEIHARTETGASLEEDRFLEAIVIDPEEKVEKRKSRSPKVSKASTREDDDTVSPLTSEDHRGRHSKSSRHKDSISHDGSISRASSMSQGISSGSSTSGGQPTIRASLTKHRSSTSSTSSSSHKSSSNQKNSSSSKHSGRHHRAQVF